MKECKVCNTKFNSQDWECPVCDFKPEFSLTHHILHPDVNEDLGFKQESFEKLYKLEADNFWFRSRNQLIIWAIKKYFEKPKKLLEIGCGTGFVLSAIHNKFPQVTLTGSDISCTGLSFAAKRLSNVEMVQFDARTIPFYNEFDVIGSFDVLEHVDDDVEVLNQMHKATVKGGGIIITVPQHQFLWSHADEQACHKRRYSAEELLKRISAAGFDLVWYTSFVTLLFPAMLLSRVLKKGNTEGKEPYSELKLPGIINYSFEKVLSPERLIIKSGVMMPFGGSLLLIARKTE